MVGHTYWQLLIWQVRHPLLAVVDLYSAGLFKRTEWKRVRKKKKKRSIRLSRTRHHMPCIMRLQVDFTLLKALIHSTKV